MAGIHPKFRLRLARQCRSTVLRHFGGARGARNAAASATGGIPRASAPARRLWKPGVLRDRLLPSHAA
jgi:hypothetical protein